MSKRGLSTFVENLHVPAVKGRHVFDCLRQIGIDLPVDNSEEMTDIHTIETQFSKQHIQGKIAVTRKALTSVLHPEFLQDVLHSERQDRQVDDGGKNQMVAVAGPISLDLSLIFRDVGGAIVLEDVDLMAGGTGLKAVAASRFGIRTKFFAMGEDPLMRKIFSHWSNSIGDSFVLEEGPSRVVPHITVLRSVEGRDVGTSPAVLVPPISLSPEEGNHFLGHLEQHLPDTKECDPLFLCFNGRHTFPGLQPEFYGSLMEIAKRKGYRIVADMRLGMTEQEMYAIYESSPWMVKPNLAEFLKFYRYVYPEIPIPTSPTKDEIGNMASDISHRFSINVLAVTLGKGGAVLIVRRPRLHGVLASSTKADEVSPIGCGDAFTGAFLAQYIEHADYDKALRYATAAGAETAKEPGTRIAQREQIESAAADLQKHDRCQTVGSPTATSFIRENLFQQRGYILRGSNERGGSSMQTFVARRKSDGLECIIKYSDWDGVSSDGIPWLLGQAIKLKALQADKDVPQELKELYPKVVEIFQGENVAYYVMEVFPGAQDLARHYLDNPEATAPQMFTELSGVFKQLLRAYITRPIERRGGEVGTNLLNRAERRLEMLANKSEHHVYRRLVEGRPFVLGSLCKRDASQFFAELMEANSIVINETEFPNLPQLLRVIRDHLPQLQDEIGPTHFSILTHGDLSIRNFLKSPNGDVRIIDVRSPTRIHSVTPDATSIEYDFAKLYYSPIMELVRNEYSSVRPEGDWKADRPSFQFDYSQDPTVSRFMDLRTLLHEQFVDDDMRRALNIRHQEWSAFPLFGEALNYTSDAVHRLSQDPSGKHSLMYYLEAVRLLTKLLSDRKMLPAQM